MFRRSGCARARRGKEGSVARRRIHSIPEWTLERRYVQRPAIACDRHAVAAAFIGPVPYFLFRVDIERRQPVHGADVKLPRLCAGRDALYIFRLFPGRHNPGRNALHESISVVAIKHQDADAAILHIIANAGNRDVEEAFFLRDGILSRR